MLGLESTRAHDSRAATELPICIEGRAVPRLHLLGFIKCGTTTLAKDMRNAGVEWFNQGNWFETHPPPYRYGGVDYAFKEGHLYDYVCGLNPQSHRMGLCPNLTEGLKESWLGSIHQRGCSEPGPTLQDSTPTDARLPNLPAFMAGIYGVEASRLCFVFILREPMARLQSHWYMEHRKEHPYGNSPASNTSSFGAYVSGVLPLLQSYKARNYVGMESDENANLVYQGMYSLLLAKWLETFSYQQFALLLNGFYFENRPNREYFIRRIAEKFGATISPADLPPLETHANFREHPPLDSDITSAEAAQWYDEIFRPMISDAAALAAAGMPDGLEVIGYAGPPSSEQVFSYLCTALPCLL